MPEQQSSPQPTRRRTNRQTLQQKLQGYQSDLQSMYDQLLTENNLRDLLKDSVLVTSYKEELSHILKDVKRVADKSQAQAYFKGIGTFCERIDDAITQLDVTLDALDILNQKFDADIRTQAYNALKKCRTFLGSALQQLFPPEKAK